MTLIPLPRQTGDEPYARLCRIPVDKSVGYCPSMKALTLVAAALGAAVLLAATPAGGARFQWEPYLAPPSACPGSLSLNAAPAVQRRAVLCLVTWARAQVGLGALPMSDLLSLAARRKGQRVAVCRDFSHTPCGIRMTASVRSVGYSYATFAENLFFGEQDAGTAYSAMQHWLASRPHRENLLAPNWHEAGVALLRVPELDGGLGVTLWVMHFAQAL